MGLVDMVVDAASLEEVAIKSAEDLANGTLKVKRAKGAHESSLEDIRPVVPLYGVRLKRWSRRTPTACTPHPMPLCVKYGLEHPRAMINSSIEREERPNSPRLKSPTPDWHLLTA
jgi:hypothetical protein